MVEPKRIHQMEQTNMIRPYAETKNTYDQYSFGDSSGIFISQWCLISIHHFTNRDGGWMFGLIIFNISFGLWNET